MLSPPSRLSRAIAMERRATRATSLAAQVEGAPAEAAAASDLHAEVASPAPVPAQRHAERGINASQSHRHVVLSLRYPRPVSGKTVASIELWLAADASPGEVRLALNAALSAQLRLPPDAAYKLLRWGVPCALSAGALLADDASSLRLDAGPPPAQPSWWKAHAAECAFLLFGLLFALSPALLYIPALALSAAAAAPGRPGALSLLLRAAPTAACWLVALCCHSMDEALVPAALANSLLGAATAAALFSSRIVTLSAALMLARALVARAAATEARWKKAH